MATLEEARKVKEELLAKYGNISAGINKKPLGGPRGWHVEVRLFHTIPEEIDGVPIVVVATNKPKAR